MLHITTEIGKPGKHERERRHFPYVHNHESSPFYKPRGRRYIPHGHGMYNDWQPHPQHITPEYTDIGPDWKSKIRYIPDPQDPKYPAAEIFENNWKAMRPFPYTYMNTSSEWILDPGLSNKGMRCKFNGEHLATRTSIDELTHSMLYGQARNAIVIDKRNGIGQSSPGDKAYKVPSYSPKFHTLGSTLPVINFGAHSSWKKESATFVPLQPMPTTPRESFSMKAKHEEKEIEKNTVKELDNWCPAPPLKADKVDDKKSWV